MCCYILKTFNPREHTYYDLAEEAFASNSLSNYYLLILASYFTMPADALCLSIWTKQNPSISFKQNHVGPIEYWLNLKIRDNRDDCIKALKGYLENGTG